MYFYLHRNSKKWTLYSVKIVKCEYFSSALQRNSEKGPFYSVKFLKVGVFLSLSVKTQKSYIFNA